jgi:hypothetical protein
MQIRPRTRSLVAALTAAVAALTVGASALPAQANPDHVDPAALDRGAAPRVAHLIGNTIHDGDRAIRVRRASMHLDLWTTDSGYVVTDRVRGQRNAMRVTAVGKTGERKVIARPHWLDSSAMSPQGTRMALADAKGDLATPMVVTVLDPDTGEVKARRSFKLAQVVAVTGRRVLLTRPGYRRDIETWWWNYRRDTTRKISDQYAIRADVRHNRVVFAPRSTSPARCHRVAPLSRPGRTLWRSCGITPHAWSPNGERALSTHIYFDVPGTDHWVTVDARTGERGSRVNGRLDWDVAWEGNGHFLTMAQGDDGNAAIIRCTPTGSCERASRVWDLEIDPDAYYVAPPVLLASNN